MSTVIKYVCCRMKTLGSSKQSFLRLGIGQTLRALPAALSLSKTTVVLMCVLCTSNVAMAQHHFQPVLDTLQRQGTKLALLHQQTQTLQSLSAATPLLSDPNASFEYLWASRTGEGNRWNVGVSQELPLAQYGIRHRLRRLIGDSTETSWLLQRQQWLLEAQHLCAEVVYANMQLAHLSHCIDMAQRVADAMARRMELGDCSVIEYNRAQLELVSLQNKKAVIANHRDNRLSLLHIYGGNADIALTDTIFPSITLYDDFDVWYDRACRQAPEIQLKSLQTQMQYELFRLSKREALPHISAGFVAAYEADCLFRGLSVGLSLPLWNRHRQVEVARQMWHLAQQQEIQSEIEFSGRLRMYYSQVQSLASEVYRLDALCIQYESESLLLKSFLLGELSLESYLRQVEFFHDMRQTVIDTRYALECAWLDLMAVTL